MLTIVLVLIFTVILSSLCTSMLYINQNIKNFIDIEHNDSKIYLKVFSILFLIILVFLYIFSLLTNTNGALTESIYSGDPPF